MLMPVTTSSIRLYSHTLLQLHLTPWVWDSMDDVPCDGVLSNPEDVRMLPVSERRDILNKMCKKVVDSLVKFSFNDHPTSTTDQVFSYAQQILSLGCFYLELCDGIKEGDGEC